MRHNHRVRRTQAMVAVVAVVVTLAVGGAALTRDVGSTAPPAHLLPAPDPARPTHAPLTQAPLTHAPVPAGLRQLHRVGTTTQLDFSDESGVLLSAGFGSVWAVGEDKVIRVSEASHRITHRFALSATQLVAGSDAMYAVGDAGDGTSHLERIDPATSQVTQLHKYASVVDSLGVTGGQAYAVQSNVGTYQLVVVNLATHAARTIDLPDGMRPSGGLDLAVSGGVAWVIANDNLLEVNLASGRTTVRPVDSTGQAPANPKSVFVGAGSVWLANDNNQGYGALWKVDQATGRVLEVAAGEAVQVAFSPGSLWVGSTKGVRQYDVAGHRYSALAVMPPPPSGGPSAPGVVVVGHTLWAADPWAMVRVSLP